MLMVLLAASIGLGGALLTKKVKQGEREKIYKELRHSARSGGTVAIKDGVGKPYIIRVRKAW